MSGIKKKTAKNRSVAVRRSRSSPRTVPELSSPAKRTRSEKSAETRDRILAVAGPMFAERGFDAVTTRQIAGAAKVTFPVMYRHFRDKRALYLSAFGSALGKINYGLLAILNGKGTPEERLLSFMTALYEDLLKDPCVPKLLQREILDSDEKGLGQLAAHYFVGPYTAVRGICDAIAGQSKSEFAAFAFFFVTFGFIQLRPIAKTIGFLEGGWRDPRSVGREILTLVLPQVNWAAVKESS